MCFCSNNFENVAEIKWETKRTTLSEQLTKPIQKSQKETKSVHHIHMTAHFPVILLTANME